MSRYLRYSNFIVIHLEVTVYLCGTFIGTPSYETQKPKIRIIDSLAKEIYPYLGNNRF